jgi:malate dehydrogenase
VLVPGNPANTNALIAMSNAPDIPPERFTAMTRLDHNRAIGQLAKKAGAPVTDIAKMTIWGNHSATQYPGHLPRRDRWPERRGSGRRPGLAGERLHPDGAEARRRHHRGPWGELGGQRGVRGHRPRARLDAGHPDDGWVSMAVASDGSYGVPEGLVSSFPCRTKDGEWSIVQGTGHRRLLSRPH